MHTACEVTLAAATLPQHPRQGHQLGDDDGTFRTHRCGCCWRRCSAGSASVSMSVCVQRHKWHMLLPLQHWCVHRRGTPMAASAQAGSGQVTKHLCLQPPLQFAPWCWVRRLRVQLELGQVFVLVLGPALILERVPQRVALSQQVPKWRCSLLDARQRPVAAAGWCRQLSLAWNGEPQCPAVHAGRGGQSQCLSSLDTVPSGPRLPSKGRWQRLQHQGCPVHSAVGCGGQCLARPVPLMARTRGWRVDAAALPCLQSGCHRQS